MQQLQSDGSYNELYPKTDAWTKDETLSAQVASVLGLRDNYKPDDAFLGLYFGAGTYRYRVRVVLEDGTPVQGSTISGISAIQGQSLVTNEQGYVLGKSTSQSVTISCTSPFVDQKAPDSQVIVSNGIITSVILNLTKIESRWVTNSANYFCSSQVKTVDFCGVGGGQSGGSGSFEGYSRKGGMGAGRGYLKNVPINTGDKITLTIGGVVPINSTNSNTTIKINDSVLSYQKTFSNTSYSSQNGFYAFEDSSLMMVGSSGGDGRHCRPSLNQERYVPGDDGGTGAGKGRSAEVDSSFRPRANSRTPATNYGCGGGGGGYAYSQNKGDYAAEGGGSGLSRAVLFVFHF